MGRLFDKSMKENFERIVRLSIKETVRDRVSSVFSRMVISVDVTDKNGQSSIAR